MENENYNMNLDLEYFILNFHNISNKDLLKFIEKINVFFEKVNFENENPNKTLKSKLFFINTFKYEILHSKKYKELKNEKILRNFMRWNKKLESHPKFYMDDFEKIPNAINSIDEIDSYSMMWMKKDNFFWRSIFNEKNINDVHPFSFSRTGTSYGNLNKNNGSIAKIYKNSLPYGNFFQTNPNNFKEHLDYFYDSIIIEYIHYYFNFTDPKLISLLMYSANMIELEFLFLYWKEPIELHKLIAITKKNKNYVKNQYRDEILNKIEELLYSFLDKENIDYETLDNNGVLKKNSLINLLESVFPKLKFFPKHLIYFTTFLLYDHNGLNARNKEAHKNEQDENKLMKISDFCLLLYLFSDLKEFYDSKYKGKE